LRAHQSLTSEQQRSSRDAITEASLSTWPIALSLNVIGEQVVSYSVVVENVGGVLSVFYEYSGAEH